MKKPLKSQGRFWDAAGYSGAVEKVLREMGPRYRAMLDMGSSTLTLTPKGARLVDPDPPAYSDFIKA